MISLMTTKMSSKGQVVVPEALREQLGWGTGTSFTMVVYKDSIIMKPVAIPTAEELDAEYGEALAECRLAARRVGFSKADLNRILEEDRAERLSKTTRRTRR